MPSSNLDVLPKAATIERNRRAIFNGIGELLLRFSLLEHEAGDWRHRAPVWAHGIVLGKPKAEIAPDCSHLRVDWERGLSASIVLRLGECRIGLLIGNDQAPNLDALNAFYPYPEDRITQREYPARVVRRIGDAQTLIDYVFSGSRFADLGLTRSALIGNPVDMALLIDSLSHEIAHLASALVHHLALAGFYFGEGPSTNFESRVFITAHADVGSALNLTPAQLYLVGDGDIPGTRKWMAIIPPGQIADFEARLKALG